MTQTFIHLTESDNQLGFDSACEAVVFASIKSWCNQGKKEVDLSYRQIQSYIPYVSIGTIKAKIDVLIKKKLINIVGEKTRVGGSCPIYKVFSHRTVSVQPINTLSVQPLSESVQPLSESVQSVGTNSPKIRNKNKEIKELFEFFNSRKKRNISFGTSDLKNFEHWIKTYTLSEMKQALLNALEDDFWADKMTPTILLRQKNPSGEGVDRIGEFLNRGTTGVETESVDIFKILSDLSAKDDAKHNK